MERMEVIRLFGASIGHRTEKHVVTGDSSVDSLAQGRKSTVSQSTSIRLFGVCITLQDSPTNSTNICFPATGQDHKDDEEEKVYTKKIEELITEKSNELAPDQQVIEPKKEKKTTSRKHQRSVDKNDGIKNKKMKKSELPPVIINDVTKRLEEFIKSDEINGKEMMLLIQKKIFKSDLKRDQNRLSMPINQLRTLAFLRDDEKKGLDYDKLEIDVQLVGPTLRMHDKPMKLIMWKLTTTNNYVLKTNWNNFVQENKDDLKEKSIIQVWSFRKDDKLCFAIVVVERALED